MSKRLGNILIALGALCVAASLALLLHNDAEARAAAAASDAVLPVLAEAVAARGGAAGAGGDTGGGADRGDRRRVLYRLFLDPGARAGAARPRGVELPRASGVALPLRRDRGGGRALHRGA